MFRVIATFRRLAGAVSGCSVSAKYVSARRTSSVGLTRRAHLNFLPPMGGRTMQFSRTQRPLDDFFPHDVPGRIGSSETVMPHTSSFRDREQHRAGETALDASPPCDSPVTSKTARLRGSRRNWVFWSSFSAVSRASLKSPHLANRFWAGRVGPALPILLPRQLLSAP